MSNRTFVYYVQGQNPSGNWFDILGCMEDDLKSAMSHYKWHCDKEPSGNYRVVKRTDDVVALSYALVKL